MTAPAPALVAEVVATTPAGEDPGRPPDELIGPGTVGFIAIFLLSVVVILLIRDMNRRVQRMRYRRVAREQARDGTARDGTPQDGTAQEDPDAQGPSGPR